MIPLRILMRREWGIVLARNKYDIDETLQTEFNISHLKRLAGYIRPYSGDMILIVFNDSVLRIRNGNTKDSYENS